MTNREPDPFSRQYRATMASCSLPGEQDDERASETTILCDGEAEIN